LCLLIFQCDRSLKYRRPSVIKNNLEHVKRGNSLSKGTSSESEGHDEEDRKLSVYQKRKKMLGKLINKVDQNIAISENCAVREAAQMLPPTLLTLKPDLSTKVNAAMKALHSQPKPATVSQAAPETARQKLSQPPTSYAPPLSARKPSMGIASPMVVQKPLTSKSQPSSRKKSVTVGKKKKKNSVAMRKKDIKNVVSGDLQKDISEFDSDIPHDAQLETEERGVELENSEITVEEEDMYGDEDVEYSIHSVPSVLSNPEFGQKHSRRTSVKVPKSRENTESTYQQSSSARDDSTSQQNLSMSTVCDSIEEDELHMGSPGKLMSEQKQSKGFKKKDKNADIQRRESIQGLLQVYREHDGRTDINIHVPTGPTVQNNQKSSPDRTLSSPASTLYDSSSSLEPRNLDVKANAIKSNAPDDDARGVEQLESPHSEKRKTSPTVRFQDDSYDTESDLDVGSPSQRRGESQQDVRLNVVPSSEMSTQVKQAPIEVSIPLVTGAPGDQATQWESFRHNKLTSSSAMDVNERNEANIEVKRQHDFGTTVLTSCRESVSAEAALPKSLNAQISEENPIDLTSVILAKKGDDDDGSTFNYNVNPFIQHVPSIDSSSIQNIANEKNEREMESRNKELEYIIQLLESGMKDHRYEERRRIMQDRRLKEERIEKKRQQHARQCDECLRGILNRMDPVIGERIAFGLRQRQDKRTDTKHLAENSSGDDNDEDEDEDEVEEEDTNDSVSQFQEMSLKLNEEEDLVETNLSQLHLEEVADDSKLIALDQSMSEGDITASASMSLQELDERSQVRSQYLAQESERLLLLKAQVEQRRKEAADRKLSILVKLTRRINKNEVAFSRDCTTAPSTTNKLVILGNQAGPSMAQKRRAEQHAKAQQHLVSKINQHVKFLNTHVINMADTAKLPFESDDLPSFPEVSRSKDDIDLTEETDQDDGGDQISSNESGQLLEKQDGTIEHFPESFKNLSLGSTLLEQDSTGEWRSGGTGESQSETPVHSVTSAAHTHSEVNEDEKVVPVVRQSDLTEQRIDEVVGSYNLTDLKKFRIELIRCVRVVLLCALF